MLELTANELDITLQALNSYKTKLEQRLQEVGYDNELCCWVCGDLEYLEQVANKIKQELQTKGEER